MQTGFTPISPGSAPNTQWVKVTLGYATFSTAALFNDVEVLSLAPKQVIHGLITKYNQFAGTLIASVTASVGPATNFTKYMTALNVNDANVDVPTSINSNMGMESFANTTSIRCKLIAIGANLSALTQGSIDFYFLLSNLP